MGHIVNQRHYDRLKGLINQEKIIFEYDQKENGHFLSPIIMKNVTWDDKIMQEEIFGPILPILTFKHIDHVIELT